MLFIRASRGIRGSISQFVFIRLSHSLVRAFSAPGLEERGGARYFPPMPIYEFHCHDCNNDAELLVRSINWQGTACPKCGSTKLEKKFSTFASSVAGGGGGAGAVCTTKPSSCGMCGTGKPHSH